MYTISKTPKRVKLWIVGSRWHHHHHVRVLEALEICNGMIKTLEDDNTKIITYHKTLTPCKNCRIRMIFPAEKFRSRKPRMEVDLKILFQN